ncbi:hypothetical protein CH333_07985 [candidate division WOR-3 bacterium JGI_Cruoil_03_44_89]|uniref:Pyridoxamine 5'-phosphate oxidase N-terminal domain-containing protein n=1 Tax=candidate division WOR-3 bacterium JGI_Cruoil_03_44_89 TaxID=1973748 RepID=A0A235BRR3_UNCW3|nr:MAG: hypothetical protein CH333_07985 [candidate division WOR-3 bacterium JGI_Cruoil_03_44_89]
MFLGTAEGAQPRVRPVTLISLDKKLWVTTGTRNAKVKQIRDNPKVEFCLYLRKGGKDCYVRIAGVAKIVMDRETKAKIAGHCDFFNKYFESVDDPNYSLIEICPVEIEYLRPGEFQARKIKL